MNLDNLVKKLDYEFKNVSLLTNALTHSSFLNEAHKKNVKSNERLEFLGDSVLGLTVSEYIFKNYPKYPEGELSKIRAAVVCEASLAKVAEKLDIGKYMSFSKGEKLSGGDKKPSVLSDAVESVIAAIFLDGGMEPAKRFVLTHLESQIKEAAKYGGDDEDYKSRLQEYAQSVGKTVSYEILSQIGPDHNAQFEACVNIDGVMKAKGIGSSKKKAEAAAARGFLEKLKR